MKNFIKYQKLTLLWALFVLVLCSIPIGNAEVPGHFLFPGFDKLVHCGFFFVFTVLLYNGLIRQQEKLSVMKAVITIITGMMFGALIEVLQATVFTWRDGDWSDLFSDCVGVGMGAFCTLIIMSAMRYEKA